MPKRKVHLIPGNYYHIYNKAVTDNNLFIEEKNYRFFLTKIKKYLLNSVDILAYRLMPNHYHFDSSENDRTAKSHAATRFVLFRIV